MNVQIQSKCLKRPPVYEEAEAKRMTMVLKYITLSYLQSLHLLIATESVGHPAEISS